MIYLKLLWASVALLVAGTKQMHLVFAVRSAMRNWIKQESPSRQQTNPNRALAHKEGRGDEDLHG